MENYDLDVNALEDLCANLEEPAFLIDKSHNIIWANEVFKKRYAIPIGTNYSNMGKLEISHPSTMECLELGRLIKVIIKKDSYSIKLISLPIKYGSETVSVLQLIEYIDVPDSENSIIMDSHTILLKLFLNDVLDSALLTDKNNIAITFNSLFEKEFLNTPELKELVLKQLSYTAAKEVYDNIQRIMSHSHNVSRKILEENGRVIGYIYIFKLKNGSKTNYFKKTNRRKHNISKR